MKLGFYLAAFVRDIIAAIDTGNYKDIAITEVEEHIEKGDLMSYLNSQLKRDIDLSLFPPEVKEEIIKKLRYMLSGYKGSERRKWGIVNSGLCLLATWSTKPLEEEIR